MAGVYGGGRRLALVLVLGQLPAHGIRVDDALVSGFDVVPGKLARPVFESVFVETPTEPAEPKQDSAEKERTDAKDFSARRGRHTRDHRPSTIAPAVWMGKDVHGSKVAPKRPKMGWSENIPGNYPVRVAEPTTYLSAPGHSFRITTASL